MEKEKKIILENKVKCLKCEDIIVSAHRHDFNSCSCGKISVDGGMDYLRRSGDLDNYEDLSIYGTQDEMKYHLRWGTYGKEGDQPLTYIKLSDCEDDHLLAILENARPGLIYRQAIFELLDERNISKEDSKRKEDMIVKWDDDNA
jgi:hypothetical protein